MPSERIATKSGSETCAELLREYLGLRQKYTPEFIAELNQTQPPDMAEHARAVERLEELSELIMAHLVLRELELLEFEVADLAIEMGARTEHNFSEPLCDFLANQLWRLEGAPMEETEALAHIQTICEQAAPGEEYLATMESICICGMANCPNASKLRLVVQNRASRERRAAEQSAAEERIRVIEIGVVGGPPPRRVESIGDLIRILLGGR